VTVLVRCVGSTYRLNLVQRGNQAPSQYWNILVSAKAIAKIVEVWLTEVLVGKER
jgi:hypothetical protein